MTLKDKFADILHQTKPHFVNIDSEECQQIADNFAIGFAEWLLKFDNLKNENKYIIEQLLEIYKKEKGL